jgi:hypothetical protein
MKGHQEHEFLELNLVVPLVQTILRDEILKTLAKTPVFLKAPALQS